MWEMVRNAIVLFFRASFSATSTDIAWLGAGIWRQLQSWCHLYDLSLFIGVELGMIWAPPSRLLGGML
jgi:hypothetical protein